VRAFYAIPIADIFMFSTFLYSGYRSRSDPRSHKPRAKQAGSSPE
jgi:hypothetical protein